MCIYYTYMCIFIWMCNKKGYIHISNTDFFASVTFMLSLSTLVVKFIISRLIALNRRGHNKRPIFFFKRPLRILKHRIRSL